jgi:3-deoxy-D-manno-octulosonic-acid transferase
MIWIYSLSVWLYAFFIKLASPFHKKAALWSKGRKNIFQLLEKRFAGNTRPVVWFHAASLGEFEQARPVLESFRERHPHYRLVLTFFSPSGYEIRKNYSGADDIFYLPSDSRKHAKLFVDIVNPKLVLFVKYEFWYFYLSELHQRNIPVVLFSAIFRPEQPFFSKYTDFYRNILTFFSYLFVQDQTSVNLLHKIGIQNSENIGDTRFDRVRQLANARKQISLVENFKNNGPVFIAGSTWEADMKALIPLINHPDYQHLKFIVAPHEIDENAIAEWQKQIRRKSIRYSESSPDTIQMYDVLFINNIGLLSSLYQYAEYAWIGGAYGKGLHNILEAATYGMPVFFGTNYKKFKEACDLIRLGAAISVPATHNVAESFAPIAQNETLRQELAGVASRYVAEHTGATEKIIAHIETHYLPNSSTL